MTDLELYNAAKEAYYNGEPIMTDYEFDEFGNWIRCIRQVKDPGEPPRSTKIIERTYSYR